MEEKKFYTPQEVVEIARNYNLVSGMLNLPISAELRERYEGTIPKNIRDVIDPMNDLELKAFQNVIPD